MIIQLNGKDGRTNVIASGFVYGNGDDPPVVESVKDGKVSLRFSITTDTAKRTDQNGNVIRWTSTYANVCLYYHSEKNAPMYEMAKKLKAKQTVIVTGHIFEKNAQAFEMGMIKTPIIFADTIVDPNALALMMLGIDRDEFVAVPTDAKKMDVIPTRFQEQDSYDFD